MSMLAGPRRKQKVINLRAKNNAWSNDSSKFGQRMLEKMGWSEGKGLGAKENGIVEHVVARYKNDDKGLGFEDRNDQWTKHEDDFNALLANLSNGNDKEEQLHSGISLEVKSKKSKARIHYHKFTRGKDIARYSEKDLANIFGKKSLKGEEKKDEEVQIEDLKATEQVFTEKGSMEDYFKSKLAAFKNKANVSCLNSHNEVSNDADYSFKGFSQGSDDDTVTKHTDQGFGFQGFSFYGSKENNEIEKENEACDEITEVSQKSKKKKKSKEKNNGVKQSNEIEGDVNNEYQHVSEVCQQLSKKKKKSKNKNVESVEHCNEVDSNGDVVNDHNHELLTDIPEQPRKKKKGSKKKKNDSDQDSNEITSNNTAQNVSENTDNEGPKKRKKKGIPEEKQEFNEIVVEEEIHVPKKKKKRKNKDVDN
ncbi:PIN2/TERF1-interacting telomerase inhibitor 1-like [Pectinophora gossypiella]|uniref:G-patch domain-containing protein n=1 Tax=Pectinophora gossypiella TaxID=13191 RepID=A0A1E1WTU3_PECGO|nr:PIN2/TERF1-interacting telomerase inhibitor 1-like [Pectinophora gossypiella]